jgi:hypothetical protein
LSIAAYLEASKRTLVELEVGRRAGSGRQCGGGSRKERSKVGAAEEAAAGEAGG